METRARYILVGLFALAAIAAGFAFVYWMNNTGGLAKRAVYKIRFDGPTSGLQTGAAVQFNGIRVGEVTGLKLDTDDPRRVVATIAVANGTPLRADTKAGVDFRGLMGSPAVSLRGGASTSPLLPVSSNEPPLLVADPAATQDLTQTARQALQRLDKMLDENGDAVKSTMDNLKTFSEALGRNSNRIDGIMAGLEQMTGGKKEKPKPIYDLTAPTTFAGPTHAPRGQFAVLEPTAVNALETQRMLARSSDGEISVLGEAQWSDTLPKMIQEKVIQTFENAGLMSTVPASAERVAATYQLVLDLRSFAIVTGPEPGAQPMAEVAFSAKLVAENGHIVGAQLFHAAFPAKAMDAPAAAAALNQAFGKAVTDLTAWVSRAV
jgi:phospholipid/cholesterol/gamma-HCH transport system substrate-binding protein